VFLLKGPKAQTIQGLRPATFGAPVRMALYIQGSGIPLIPMNRTCPRPKKGAGQVQGGRSVKQEISRENMTIP